MSLAEILPEVLGLSRLDRIRLIQILAQEQELEREESERKARAAPAIGKD